MKTVRELTSNNPFRGARKSIRDTFELIQDYDPTTAITHIERHINQKRQMLKRFLVTEDSRDKAERYIKDMEDLIKDLKALTTERP